VFRQVNARCAVAELKTPSFSRDKLRYAQRESGGRGDDDAIDKAKAWAHSFDDTPEDAWLQVVMSGKGIATLRPGEF
jgi:hypothetical protein